MKITNIMFTDMVGYSKLTGDDQHLALELLKEHDKIIEPIINRYNGKIIKRIGDAIVAIFDNSGDIIQSSVEIQQSLKNRNTRNIQSRHIILRIGLHYGEILFQNEEVHGVGYEIASQIEPVCEYGGITISEDLYQQVHEKNELIVNAAKNHFFIRPVAKFNLKSSSINLYKLHLNLLDWYDEEFNQSHQYLSQQGIADKIYNPIQFKRSKDDLQNHLILAKDFEENDDLSYAIYHYKMYLDYNKLNTNTHVEFIILNIFSNCGLIRLVNRVLNTQFNEKDKDGPLYHYIMGINAFNSKDFDSAISFFKQISYFEESFNSPEYAFIDIHKFYLAVIAWKQGNQDLQLFLQRALSKKSDSNSMLLYKIISTLINENTSQDDVDLLYRETDNNNAINKTAKLCLFWLFITFYKKHDTKFALKVQDKANVLIEVLANSISGFQLKQFFLEKPLLHQLLIEEIEFNFIEDEGLDDFAEPERIKTDQLEVFNFCTECGFKNENKFQFCPSCGSKLTK